MRRIALLFCLLNFVNLYGQDTARVPYSHEYEFSEGLFLTIGQFKDNDPISLNAIVSTLPKTQLDFLTKVTSQNAIQYQDESGKKKTIQTSTVWGYCQNRNLYIFMNGDFNKINLIGSLSLFSAIVVKTTTTPYYSMGMYSSIPTTYKELDQFILDTQSGRVVEFTEQNMEGLLQPDEELYAEYMKLNRHKRNESMFVYLRKFNERNPLYLPVN
jgi:hypothetical protein